MLIIFLGPPGSGKGTQAKITAQKFYLSHFSTGDMLRAVAKSSTSLGANLREILGQGKLVDNEIVNEIVKQTLQDEKYKKGCIIDGFPRTVDQAEFLEEITEGNYQVIYLKIDVDLLKNRVEGRFSCTQCNQIYNKYSLKPRIENICDNCGGDNFEARADDNLTALIERLKQYEAETIQLISYYQQRNKIITINANNTIEEVSNQIEEAINNY